MGVNVSTISCTNAAVEVMCVLFGICLGADEVAAWLVDECCVYLTKSFEKIPHNIYDGGLAHTKVVSCCPLGTSLPDNIEEDHQFQFHDLINCIVDFRTLAEP